MFAFDTRIQRDFPQQKECVYPMNRSVNSIVDTFSKSVLSNILIGVDSGSKQEDYEASTRHFIESIKSVCFTAFLDDTTFGFKNAEVMDARYTKISGRVRKPR